MAVPPSLVKAVELCDIIAQVMNETAYLPYRDPHVDIDEYDKKHGKGVIPDPLLTAHRMSRLYLVGAGDFVYSIGKLLDLEQPMVVSPAVLARSAAEYASRCRYISVPEDQPDVRLSKLFNLYREGFNDAGVNKPDADPQLVAFSRELNDWRNQQELPKTKLPNYTALVAELAPGTGKSEYEALSGVAHASAITVTGVFIAAQLKHDKRVEDSWRHALFAAQCGLFAAAQVCVFRDGPKDPINYCLGRLDECVGAYNRYLWDLAVEQGLDPGTPRP